MTYNQISMLLGIGVMTACKCVHECTYAICRHMFMAYIRLPTPQESRANMEKWRQQTSIPGIFGAIDGTHITIKKPCESGQDYFNRKSFYSINMQGSSLSVYELIIALVDYKKRFLDIEVGWPGSVGDARIFENSYLANNYNDVLAELGTSKLSTGDDVEEDIPAFILGDSAYKNTRHLVTTYKVTECDADRSVRHLNWRLSKARYQVEHAFGLLKGRFQVFEKSLRCAAEDLPFAIHLIASICIIHNFLIDSQDTVCERDVLPPNIAERLRNLDAALASQEEDGLARVITSEDDEGTDIPQQVGAGNAQEPTRQALLRHVRWLDELE